MKSLFYIVVLYTFIAAQPASGQYFEDPYLYYSVGGGRAISPPASAIAYTVRFECRHLRIQLRKF